jgi:hypothetical protein
MIIKCRTGCTVDSGHARMGSPRPPTFSIFGRKHPGARQVPRWDSKSTWSTTHTRSAAMPSSHGDQLVPTPQRRTRAAATVSRTMACTPPSRATLTNPPARLAARPIPSQGRAGAPVRASRCQDQDDQSPPACRTLMATFSKSPRHSSVIATQRLWGPPHRQGIRPTARRATI